MKMFKQAQKYGSRALVVAAATVAASAHAAVGDNPIVVLLDSVGLDGVTAAIAAAALIIVAIALTLKGPSVAKRVIKQV